MSVNAARRKKTLVKKRFVLLQKREEGLYYKAIHLPENNRTDQKGREK